MDHDIRLPNTIVIGAPKSGTTSLFYYLKGHPSIYAPVRKELHYFSYDLLARHLSGPGDGVVMRSLCATREEYMGHYAAARTERVIVEVSPSYMYYADEVSERIKDELGSVKIVALLRDPVERAFSQYMYLVRENRETLSFYDALMVEQERENAGWSDIWRYSAHSCYASSIRKYVSAFGCENIRVILTHELAVSTEHVLADLFVFLGVDSTVRPDTTRIYNRSGEPRSRFVADFFARSNIVKSIGKAIIPERIRVPLRLTILDLNTGAKREIDQRSRQLVMERCHSDVVELERLLGRTTGWLA